jgi:hypothetical protein
MKTILLLIALGLNSTMSFGQQLKNNYVNKFARSGSNYQPLITTSNSNTGDLIIFQQGNYYHVNGSTGDSLSAGTLTGKISTPKTAVTSNGFVYIAGVGDNKPQVAKLNTKLDTVWNTTLFATTSYAGGVSAILVDTNDLKFIHQ